MSPLEEMLQQYVWKDATRMGVKVLRYSDVLTLMRNMLESDVLQRCNLLTCEFCCDTNYTRVCGGHR